MSKRINHRRSHLGHTLLEVVLSITLLSIIAVSVGSAVIFASSAAPGEDSVEATLATDGRVIGKIAEDLSVAKYVLEMSDHAVTVVVADRTGDNIPDRIRYAWSGKAGDPLTIQLNDGSETTLIEQVAVFSLVYQNDTESNVMPTAVSIQDESLLDAFTTTTGWNIENLTSSESYGQMMTLKLDANSLGFLPTRIDLLGSSKPPNNGTGLIDLVDRTDSAPGTKVYGTHTFQETLLTTSRDWNKFSLSDVSFVEPDQPLAMKISHLTGQNEIFEISRQSAAASYGGHYGGHLSSRDKISWSLDNGKTFVYRFYGKEIVADSEQYSTVHAHLKTVSLSLQSVADNRSPLQRKVRMMLAPSKLEAFAEIGFDVDPTTMDLDGNGETEWEHSEEPFPASSITNGIWTCDGTLTFAPDDLSSFSSISVTARMRSNDTLGPAIYGPHTINESDELLPIITQLRSDGLTGQELVIYNDAEMTAEFLVIPDLPAGLVDIKLTVIPGEDYLSVEVNHEEKVAVLLDRTSDPGSVEEEIRIGSSGGVAEFGSITVRAGGLYSKTSRSGTSDLIPGLRDLMIEKLTSP